MVSPNCGTDPVELLAYWEQSFDMPQKLSVEFTKQFPNVTWDIRLDQFANMMQQSPLLLAGDNPPDLIRLPSMVSLVKDGLLLNLDPYVTAYGWDKWPPAELVQNRVNADGQRGDGSLYAAGLNYSMTGVFYNKDLAAQIGMTEPPKTLAEFEALLQKAKDANLLPIMQWGSAKSGMGLAFPLQNLMASVGPTAPINDWIFQKPGATIDTPSNLEAAQHLETWIKNGYFPTDINAIEYTDANARFSKGEGVFMFNGDWQNAPYDKGPAKVGFFLMPPATEGGTHGAMSAPLTNGIAAKAKHADCAAFFLNWAATDPTARQIERGRDGFQPGRSGRPGDAQCRSGVGDQRDTRRRRHHRQGQWRDGLHRQRDGLDLRPGLDPRAPEDGRRATDRGRPAQGCPGRVRVRTGPVTFPSYRDHG